MSNKSKFVFFLLVLSVLFLVISPALASPRRVSFHLEEPLIVGDQIYEKGEVVFTHLQVANLVSLRINGKHIGLLENSGWSRRPLGSRPILVCERGEDGLLRLKSVQFRGDASPRTLEITFRPVALLPGIAPVPTLVLPDEQTAVANR